MKTKKKTGSALSSAEFWRVKKALVEAAEFYGHPIDLYWHELHARRLSDISVLEAFGLSTDEARGCFSVMPHVFAGSTEEYLERWLDILALYCRRDDEN